LKARLHDIPLAHLIPPPNPIRESLDPDGIAELADSLRTLGQLQPILVARQGEKWRIIAGHRRYLAALRTDLKSLKAIETDGRDGNEILIMVAENCARQDLTPWEEAQVIHTLVVENGRDLDQVARAFGKSRAWTEKRLEIHTWPTDVTRAVHKGLLAIGAATELAHITDQGYREYLLTSAISGGCTTTTARLWRTEWEARGQPTMQTTTDQGEQPTYHPPPAAGLECSSCGTLTRLQDLRTLHVCSQCLAGKETRP
jgi:ParB/RepB/Spo0J family partition protein